MSSEKSGPERIRDQDEADAIFEQLVQQRMTKFGISREQAEAEVAELWLGEDEDDDGQ